ncbi:hypothetical protein [Mycobacterium riyadhense]|nr:hypothetical protein [Mycobacterium riyadhense]
MVLSGCGGGPKAAVTSTVTVSATAAPSMKTSAATPTGSSDPIYDKYAATMRNAGIDFVPGLGSGASYDYDTTICTDLRSGYLDAYELKYFWFADRRAGDASRRIPAMVPILCPEQQSVVDEALGPDPKMMHFSGKKNFVGTGLNCPGCGTKIQPGTYKTGRVENCYWARLDGQGNIIDNNMVSLSESVVVTIAQSDAAFESDNCGTWTRVD